MEDSSELGKIKEAKAAIFPHSRTFVERLDSTPVLHHESIPLFSDTNEVLYGDIKASTFDYIDLKLSDYIKESPANKEVWEKSHDYEKRNYPENTPDFQTWLQKKIKTKKFYPILPGYFLSQKYTDTKNKDIQPLALHDTSTRQCYAIMGLLGHVFRFRTTAANPETDWQLFKDFQLDLQRDSEKPPLLIAAHGGTRMVDGKATWVTGERGGNAQIPVDRLLKHIYEQKGSNYYSAILMDICNPDRFVPKKFDQVPIYYSEGDAMYVSNVPRNAQKV